MHAVIRCFSGNGGRKGAPDASNQLDTSKSKRYRWCDGWCFRRLLSVTGDGKNTIGRQWGPPFLPASEPGGFRLGASPTSSGDAVIRPQEGTIIRTGSGGPGPGRGSVALDLTVALFPLLAVSVSAMAILGLPRAYLLLTVGLHGAMAAMLLKAYRPGLPGPGLGAANRVTLGRSVLVLSVAAMVPWGPSLGPQGLWWIIGASALALLLDGVDGRVARSTGTSTSLGARFDMELDAFLLLALSLLLWLTGPLGPWVILIGALRYLFVFAGWFWSALQAPLPESMRRKTVCVVQGVGLVVALAPIIPPAMSTPVAATALAALIYSFVVDVMWLSRQSRTSPA